jgi:hypothetical protein
MSRQKPIRIVPIPMVAILALVAAICVPLGEDAHAAPACAPQRSGTWDGTWASAFVPSSLGTLSTSLKFTDSTVTGSASLTGSLFAGGPITGDISCNTVTFGTVGGEIIFLGQLAADGLSASGEYAVSGDRGTWQASVTRELPLVSIGSAATYEGNVGKQVLRFPVTLSKPWTAPVTVNFETGWAPPGPYSDATPGIDYRSKQGKIAFTPSSTTGLTPVVEWVSVTVLPDFDLEGHEPLGVTLTTVTGAIGDDTSAVDTIWDGFESGGAIVSLGDGEAAVAEGDEGRRQVTVGVALSFPQPIDVTVEWSTSDATAVAPGDYRPMSGFLTFKPGQVSKRITVAVMPDLVAEGTESFAVSLLDATGAAIDTGSIQVYIEDQ